MNPYEVLLVSRPATDESIRKAYLKLIQAFPPDRDPVKFKQISHAYEQIKDQKSRMRHLIFNQECAEKSPLALFLEYCRSFPREKMNRDPVRTKEFLQSCAKQIYS
jgi:curved DNA-binding protein CbpA